jgi:hypothetical protein
MLLSSVLEVMDDLRECVLELRVSGLPVQTRRSTFIQTLRNNGQTKIPESIDHVQYFTLASAITAQVGNQTNQNAWGYFTKMRVNAHSSLSR